MSRQNTPKRICGLLAVATAGLLSSKSTLSQNAWEGHVGMLNYSEKGRVTAREPSVRIRHNYGIDMDKSIEASLTFDTISGASPNGALPYSGIQTFTSASAVRKKAAGEDDSSETSSKTTSGETPVDDTFRDERITAGLSWSVPINNTNKATLGLSYSKETDYTSHGINASIATDLNQRNTSLQFGIAVANDTIKPIHGAAIGLETQKGATLPDGTIIEETAHPADGDKKTKRVYDLLLGVTQVINKRMLMGLNFGLTRSTGYHSDPYKILSVLDTNHSLQDYVYEKRPKERSRQNFYLHGKYHTPWNDTVGFGYRYAWGDWGVQSDTINLEYRLNLGRLYIKPKLRFYKQKAADFYQSHLTQNSFPEFASADHRLATFSGETFGLVSGFRITNNQEITLGIEHYTQKGDGQKTHEGYTIYPKLKATILTLGYSF